MLAGLTEHVKMKKKDYDKIKKSRSKRRAPVIEEQRTACTHFVQYHADYYFACFVGDSSGH